VTETGRAGHYLCSHQTRSHKHSLVPSIRSTLLLSISVIRVLFVSIVYISNKSFSVISMEVASLVFAVLPLVFPALEYFERTREWHIVAEVQFLQVFDVPWDKGLESKIILSLECPPGKIEDIPQALQALPAPSPRCYRFFISENIDGLENSKPLHGPTRQSSRSPYSSSFAGLRSQWRNQQSARAWLSSSYSMLKPPEHDAKGHRPPLSFTASLMRLTKRIRVSQDSNDLVSGMFGRA
jgi:hypothetical protein